MALWSALGPESHSCLIYRSAALHVLRDLRREGGLRAGGQGEDPGAAKHHAGVDRRAAVHRNCQGGQVLTLTCTEKKQKQNSNLKSSISSIMSYHSYEYWWELFKTEIFGQKAITYPMPVLCDDFYCSALLTRGTSGRTGGAPCQSSSCRLL